MKYEFLSTTWALYIERYHFNTLYLSLINLVLVSNDHFDTYYSGNVIYILPYPLLPPKSILLLIVKIQNFQGIFVGVNETEIHKIGRCLYLVQISISVIQCQTYIVSDPSGYPKKLKIAITFQYIPIYMQIGPPGVTRGLWSSNSFHFYANVRQMFSVMSVPLSEGFTKNTIDITDCMLCLCRKEYKFLWTLFQKKINSEGYVFIFSSWGMCVCI